MQCTLCDGRNNTTYISLPLTQPYVVVHFHFYKYIICFWKNDDILKCLVFLPRLVLSPSIHISLQQEEVVLAYKELLISIHTDLYRYFKLLYAHQQVSCTRNNVLFVFFSYTLICLYSLYFATTFRCLN